jgi:hypothetical protein
MNHFRLYEIGKHLWLKTESVAQIEFTEWTLMVTYGTRSSLDYGAT